MTFSPASVTFIVKTLARPEALGRLLASLWKFYPDFPILIADDSEVPYPEVSTSYRTARHATLEHDIGLSAGRNWLVDHAATPYVVLLDDDFVFVDDTRIERLYPFVASGAFDLMAGTVLYNGSETHYEHRLRREGRTLVLSPIRANTDAPIKADMVYNFFLADRAALARIRWDEALKICEHQAFFLRALDAKLNVGYLRGVRIDHRPVRSKAYGYYRRTRAQAFFKLFLERYGLDTLTGGPAINPS